MFESHHYVNIRQSVVIENDDELIAVTQDCVMGAGETDPNAFSGQSVDTHCSKNSSLVLHIEIRLFAGSQQWNAIPKMSGVRQSPLFGPRKAEVSEQCRAATCGVGGICARDPALKPAYFWSTRCLRTRLDSWVTSVRRRAFSSSSATTSLSRSASKSSSSQ
jgi:hypothetical protein